MRKILALSIALAACLGLGLAGAQSASATAASATWGAIDGVYNPGDPNWRYQGYIKDRQAGGGNVLIQRKSAATGGYTSDGFQGFKQSSYGDGGVPWHLPPTYDADTIAIRLLELGTNRTLSLCATQTACRAMR